MITLLARRLLLVSFLALAIFDALNGTDPAPQPMLVDGNPADPGGGSWTMLTIDQVGPLEPNELDTEGDDA